MKTIKTNIIPINESFAKAKKKHELNLEAICVFTAIGFFLDQDTYYQDDIVLRPGTTSVLDEHDRILKSDKHFNWYYSPRNITFETAVNEFTDLFETIIKEQSGNNSILLPLSGGLDSRSQAAALNHIGAKVNSYSYSFKNGFKEDAIGKKIAEACNFKFKSLTIPTNYVWDVIEDMAAINNCYSEFIHPRQMAVLDYLKKMEGQFSLGHWGDVLFDRGFPEDYESLSDVDIIYKKVVKKGGIELASKLWKSWSLNGDFETYLKERIQDLLNKIDIKDKSARVRAFKSLYWAPRWTSVGVKFFEAAHAVNLPYYDDRMCRFICEIPEAYLADRKIQIAYIKKRNPKLAAIEWQDHLPFNLYDYNKTQVAKSLSYRVKNKIHREMSAMLGKKHIQRNWELQFLGKSNSDKLEHYLLDKHFNEFLGEGVTSSIYDKFKNDNAVNYSHPVSMLLTLSVWFQKNKTL
ncbi:asparagine synthase-related protein [Winogradskyella forsetii]|uniref:asparagine synthase-related protein n=1 Tax=Winogradskyella forsetii TaxID=2686077 RepID=UPI0015BD75FF|nr:asparagine synthase-related protein [Winogradskyella forsetii]